MDTHVHWREVRPNTQNVLGTPLKRQQDLSLLCSRGSGIFTKVVHGTMQLLLYFQIPTFLDALNPLSMAASDLAGLLPPVGSPPPVVVLDRTGSFISRTQSTQVHNSGAGAQTFQAFLPIGRWSHGECLPRLHHSHACGRAGSSRYFAAWQWYPGPLHILPKNRKSRIELDARLDLIP